MVFISSYFRVRAESASVACVDSIVDSFIARQVARVRSVRAATRGEESRAVLATAGDPLS